MSIQVDYSPSPSTYGAAMFNTGKNLENKDTYQKMLQLLLQNKQLNQQYAYQQQQLEFQNKQLDRTNPQYSSINYQPAATMQNGVDTSPFAGPQGFLDARGWHSTQ